MFTGQNYCLLFGVVFLSKVQCNILLKFASSKYKKGKKHVRDFSNKKNSFNIYKGKKGGRIQINF